MLIAVFVPTAFMAGISGQFYKQFALTIAVSTVIASGAQPSRPVYAEQVAPVAIAQPAGGAVATQKATDAARLTVEDMAKLADGLTASVAQFKLA